jgi:hypothetical protein
VPPKGIDSLKEEFLHGVIKTINSPENPKIRGQYEIQENRVNHYLLLLCSGDCSK